MIGEMRIQIALLGLRDTEAPRSCYGFNFLTTLIHRELRRPGVTLQLLWGEHRSAHPDGYGYPRLSGMC